MSIDNVIVIAGSACGATRRPMKVTGALFASGAGNAANDDQREFLLAAWDLLSAADRAAIAAGVAKRQPQVLR
jgi:hypothetical protein